MTKYKTENELELKQSYEAHEVAFLNGTDYTSNNVHEALEEVMNVAKENEGTTQTAEQVPFESDEYAGKDVDAALNEVMQKAKEAQLAAENADVESLPAEKVTFESSNFTSQNVKAALDELFTLSDSNRNLLISAIGNPLADNATYTQIIAQLIAYKSRVVDNLQAQNVTVNNAMSLQSLADAILFIEGGESSSGGVMLEMKTTDVISATAGMTYAIGLQTYLKPSETIAQVYKLVDGQTGITHYVENFNNANAHAFDYDKENVVFDGTANIKDVHAYPFLDNGNYQETAEIDLSFVTIDSIVNDTANNTFTINGIRTTAAIVKQKSDIPIDETTEISGIGMTNQLVGNGNVRVLVSRNKGLTWQAFDGSQFVDVDIYSTSDFLVNGMTASALSTVTAAQWQDYRSGSSTMRFAYILQRPTYADNAKLDIITMQASKMARMMPAQTSEYTYTFDESAQQYIFTFANANDYKITYKDGVTK